MQLRLPFSPTGRGPVPVAPPPADLSAPIVFVRHRRARRFVLRVLADGTVRVTLPRWGAKRDAQAFVDASRDWIERQRDRRRQASVSPVVTTWRHGTEILIDGVPSPIRIERGDDGLSVWCGKTLVTKRVRSESDVRPDVERWLYARGRAELPPQLQALAQAHEILVPRVSVRGQKSRWGACSPNGTITLNWRLVQTPPFVREYVLLHELMHRRQMNHSKRFWKLVAACCPRFEEARKWLRTEGRRLW